MAISRFPGSTKWDLLLDNVIYVLVKPEYTRGRGKSRRSVASSARLSAPCLVLKNVFSFCEAWHVPSTLHMRRGIPRACLTLIHRQPMAQITAALFVAQSTLAKEKLLCFASACLCLKCISSLASES